MPIYEYKALNDKGKEVAGVIDADSPRVLRQLLRKESVFLTEYAETRKGGSEKAVVKSHGTAEPSSREVNLKRIFGRIKLIEVAVMTRQFATLLRAGIPMIESIKALVDQSENEKLKRTLSEIREAVNEGSSLANALALHPKVFSDLYVNMVRAGESSGTLDLVFERLADFTESQVKLRTKIIGIMIYPMIMLIIGTAIVTILMVFVVPKVTEMYSEMGSELPWLTRALTSVSHFLAGWGGVLLLCLFAGGVLLFRKWLKSEEGRLAWDRFVLKTPVFGSLIRLIAVGRFSKTLSTLLSSGVPLLVSMDIVKNVMNNKILSNVIEKVRESIREGESMANPLKRSEQFPPMVTHMIAIGEKSGQLENMLENVARAYEVEVDTKINSLTTVLEPVMIVCMGVVVAFLVMSILLPMLQMNDAIQAR